MVGLPGGSEGKASPRNAGDLGLMPRWGRSPGEGNGHPLQCSCLENPMDGEAWWATVHGVANRTRLNDFTFPFFLSLNGGDVCYGITPAELTEGNQPLPHNCKATLEDAGGSCPQASTVGYWHTVADAAEAASTAGAGHCRSSTDFRSSSEKSTQELKEEKNPPPAMSLQHLLLTKLTIMPTDKGETFGGRN